MRKLNLKDTFQFARLLKAMGCRQMVSDLMAGARVSQQEQRRRVAMLEAEAAKAEGAEKQRLEAALEKEKKDDSWLDFVGFDGALLLLECAAEKGVEDALCRFLAPIWEVRPEDVAEMPLPAVIDNVKQMLRENDMQTFFTSASRKAAQQ